jgi:hypothetical protein
MKYSRLWLGEMSTLALIVLATNYPRTQAAAAEGTASSPPTADRMEAARSEVANVRSNIFITLVQLDKVRGERAPGGEQFQVFTNQLGRMEALAKALGQRAEEMRQRGGAYFADWEARTASIQNPEQRRRAEDRYADRKASYDAINRDMQEARMNFMPFVDELTSIKALLEGERDPKSIAQAKDLFMRANWHCLDVQRALMQIEAEFDRLAASFGGEQ